ncbi:MAG: helix-turn-helix domain-containing protein [Gammaproteobacteria bacterium]|nr:MAG: helix-turn-helix domain-containing protein [Gammaproteobacteria bacterium]
MGQLYEKHSDAGFVCRRCGISRPTLRKWWHRNRDAGVAGLESRSSRPHNSPNTKVSEREERLILELRRRRNLGERRTQSELLRINNMNLRFV